MQNTGARTYIKALGLLPHPEGGYYRESYRDEKTYDFDAAKGPFTGKRHYSTAIYFLLEQGNFSAFHRIRSDEVWHFYAGDALEVVELDEQGGLVITRLGAAMDRGEVFQHTVKAGRWFGSRVAAGGAFSLVGCTVAPGFDFADFEMAEREPLAKVFPQHRTLIEALTRN